MNVPAMNLWLGRFVLKVRRKGGNKYCPGSLYQLCCGLLRSLRDTNHAEENLLEDPKFAEFRGVLATGEYIEQATLVMAEMKDILWEKGLLGDHCPRTLLDTPVDYFSMYSEQMSDFIRPLHGELPALTQATGDK